MFRNFLFVIVTILNLLLTYKLIVVDIVITPDALHEHIVLSYIDVIKFEIFAVYILILSSLIISGDVVSISVSRQFILIFIEKSLISVVHVTSETVPAVNGNPVSALIIGPVISSNIKKLKSTIFVV